MEVREGAMAALGSAMRVVGQAGANTLLKDIAEDKTKMGKVSRRGRGLGVLWFTDSHTNCKTEEYTFDAL